MQIPLSSRRKKPLFHIEIILIILILPKYSHSRREQENTPLVSASCRVNCCLRQERAGCTKPKMNLKYRFLTIGFVFQQYKGHILS